MAVGSEVGKIYYSLSLDTGDFNRGITTTGEALDRVSNKVTSFAKDAAKYMAVAGAAAVGFGVVAVKAFSESEDLIAQTNAVLKSTGGIAGVTADQVTQLSRAWQNNSKYSDEAVRGAENVLLTFTNIGQNIFPQTTQAVLDISTALHEDLQSAAIQVGKALQDPVLGITALRRVGVNFNDAQKEVIKNLVDTGQSAQAQALILQELQREFGGSAEAAGNTFSGSLAKLKNHLNDVEESIGQVIIGALTPLAARLSAFVSSDQFQAWLQKLTDYLSAELPIALNWIIYKAWPAFYGAVQALWPVVQLLFNTLSKLVDYMSSHHGVVIAFVDAFVALKAAAAISSVMSIARGAVAGFATEAAAGAASTGGLAGVLANPYVLGVAAAAAGTLGLWRLFEAHRQKTEELKNSTLTLEQSIHPFSSSIADAAVQVQNLGIQLTQASLGMNITTLFTQGQKNAQDDLNASKARYQALQAAQPVYDAAAQSAAVAVQAAQAAYNAAVQQYGPYSDQARDASYRLNDAQNTLNGTLATSASNHLAVNQAAWAVKGAEDALAGATANLNGWVKIANGDWEHAGTVIANIGPIAAASTGPVVGLVGQLLAVGNLKGNIDSIAQSATNAAGILQAANNNARTLQNAVSGLQIQAGSIGTQLQGAGIKLQGTRAAGGPVGAGSTYLVGEQGPEIFTPAKNGTILSNNVVKDLLGRLFNSGNALSNMFGGGHNTYVSNNIGNINISSPAMADDFLQKLSRSDQLISMGLSG